MRATSSRRAGPERHSASNHPLPDNGAHAVEAVHAGLRGANAHGPNAQIELGGTIECERDRPAIAQATGAIRVVSYGIEINVAGQERRRRR